MEKISIVIPLYNKEKSIKNTILKVLEQTYHDFELIIVNDGSTDKSYNVVSTIVDKRIRIINKNNGGVSSARNLGIKEAKYDIIAFLDADDIWDTDYLENLVNMVEKYPHAVMYAQAYNYIQNEKTFVVQNEFLKGNEPVVVDNYNKYILKTPFVWTSAVAVNKKYIEQSGLFDEMLSLGEDTDMWFRLAMCGPIVYSPFIKAHYMMNFSSTTKINLSGKRTKHIAFKAVTKYKKEYKDNEFLKKIVNTIILHGYILYLKYGEYEDAKFYSEEVDMWDLSFCDMVKYFYYQLISTIK